MKTAHSTLYRYSAETIAAANRIPIGVVNEQSHKLGMERGEPLLVIFDALLKYAEAYRICMDGNLADDPVLGDYWLDILKDVQGLLNGAGAEAMKLGRSTDSKDNSACEAVFADALGIAGFDRNKLGI